MKKIFSLLLAATLCFSLAACGNKQSGKEPAATDVASTIASQLTFKDPMTLVEDSLFSNFYRLDETKIADKAMYSGTRATAEEITVIKMNDPADIPLAEQAIAERIEDQKLAYQNYVPEELPKLEKAAVYTQGAYIILVVAEDVSKVEKSFKAQF